MNDKEIVPKYGQLGFHLAEASAATCITNEEYLMNLLLTCHKSAIVSNTARNVLNYLQFGGKKPITTQTYRQAKYEINRNGLLGCSSSRGYKYLLDWGKVKAILGVDDSRKADFFKPRRLKDGVRYSSGVLRYTQDNEVELCRIDEFI